MSLSSRYHIIDTLHASNSTVVYRALRLSDKQPVIVKMLPTTSNDEQSIAQLVNEQLLLSKLSFPYISNILDAAATPVEYFHVFEDIGGDSLYNLLLNRRFSLHEGLKIALAIAQTLDYLHQQHIIHADLNPKNIIYNPETQALRVIDFGYSVQDNHYLFSNDIHAGTSGNFLYMSPEQTGRTKQKIDYRTDFYSFGMSLYHLFAGKLPFTAKDRYALIHKQVALTLPLLDEAEASFPHSLALIVDKLVAKNPAQRYQSQEAIVYDLQRSLQLLNSYGVIQDFEIATHDQPNLHVGDQLIGRDVELDMFKQALQRAKNDGQPLTAIISGQSGVGKTRLIEEYLSFFNESHAIVLKGKCDQYKVTTPYLVFKQLFVQLHTLLMSQRIAKQKLAISIASSQVLKQVFYELSQLLPHNKTEVRFSSVELISSQLPYAVSELLAAIASDEIQLVLLIEDMQWADAASVQLLLKTLFAQTKANIHLIMSYREPDIQENQGAAQLLALAQDRTQPSPLFIHLNPLTHDAIQQLIASLFQLPIDRVQALATVVEKKTDGNPFYIRTFIEHLLDKQVIYFRQGQWEYDLEQIARASATLNIAQMISQKIALATKEERFYLQHIAVLGSRFDFLLTTQMMEALGYSQAILLQLENSGFVDCHGGLYKFTHDQIRHNVIQTIDVEMERHIHDHIGFYLYKEWEKGSYNDIIAVVQHLNAGNHRSLSTRKLLRLNLLALDALIQKNAYGVSLKQLEWIECFFDQQDLAKYPIFQETKARILYLTAQHQAAYLQTQALIAATQNIDTQLRYFVLLKNICVTQGDQFSDLLLYGNQLLLALGVAPPIDDETTAQQVMSLEASISQHSLYSHPEAIVHHQRLSAAKNKRLLSLLVNYWEGAYYLANIELMRWSYLMIIHHSFRYGNSAESSFGYVLFGAELVAQKEYKKAYAFGEAALKLNHQIDDPEMLPKIHNFFANFISPYIKHFQANLPIYQKSLQQSKINGDIVFGTWANFLMHLSDYFSGTPLEVLAQRITEDSQWLLNSGDKKMIAIFHVLVATIEQLQKGALENEVQEKEALALWEREQFYPALAWYGIIKAQTHFLLNEPEMAYRCLQRYVRHEANAVIFFPKIRLHFLRALALLSLPTKLTDAEQRQLDQDLYECDSLCDAAPKAFVFMKRLLKAERLKQGASPWQVAQAYDDAIDVARRLENKFYLALATLCAKRFWKKLNYLDIYHNYMSQALISLNQWGAHDIAQRLDHHKLTVQPVSTAVHELDGSSSSASRLESLNFKNLLAAFYAISQAIDKTAIVQQLMKVILENAGASRAVLILNEHDTFYVNASSDFVRDRVDMSRCVLNDAKDLPHSIITYAINTGRKVIANNPAETGKFQFDQYIKTKKPASAIAIPSLIEGMVRAVLYLENEAIAIPLSKEDVKTLEILLTQASIVLKNALLYETLKKNEEKLNKAQRVAHVGSWEYNWATGEVLWSAETYRIYDLEPFTMDVTYDWFVQHLHPDDVDKVTVALNEAVNGRRSYDVVHRIITASGDEKIVHQRAEVYWEDGQHKASGVIQDITESKRSESAIAKLSQVVYQNPFSTLITDTRGTIEYVNGQCLVMTGYFEHELIGQNMHLFNSGRHSPHFFRELWQTIQHQQSIWRGVIINRMKDGRLRDCDSTVFPIFNEHHEIINYVAIQEDVTERNIKDRLFLMQTRQAQMGEMLAMIAHQWRQPLAVISAIMNKQRVDVILKKSTWEGVSETLDNIEQQVQYLSRTITDFKDFFKPDKVAVMTKSSAIVGKAVDLMAHMMKRHGITVEVRHQHDVPYPTYEHEMVQVILNLLKNAQDAFIERNVVHPKIVIYSDQVDEYAILTVEDNAQGIDSEVIDTLFLPYISTKQSQNGTGLGLYMSKSIVEEHCRGHISVENTTTGARFTIRIPLIKVEV